MSACESHAVLLSALDQLASVIDALATLERAKRTALLERKLDAVESISAREKELAVRAERHSAVIRAATGANPPREQSDRQDDPDLNARRQQVRESAAQLARQTRLTELLARQSVAHFAGLLEILTGVSSKAVTYDTKGEGRPNGRSRALLDARI